MVFRKMLVVSGLLFAGSCLAAESRRDVCVTSSIQPEAIDLDTPRDQLARQNDRRTLHAADHALGSALRDDPHARVSRLEQDARL